MGFIEDWLEKILYEASRMWVMLYSELGETAFYIEKGVGDILTEGHLLEVYSFAVSFALGLIALKVLKKGFFTYILWRDGDPDAPVSQHVTNLSLAIAGAVSFPTVYGWYTEVSLWLIERVTFISFSFLDMDVWAGAIDRFLRMSSFSVVVMLIYVIMLLVLYLQFLKRSAELLLIRIAFPLACLGLLDSDNGVFATTVKLLLQASLTTAAQLYLLMLSMSIFVASDKIGKLFYCIACCMTAFGTPAMLQGILLPTGGGGTQKVTSAIYTANLLKGLLK